MNALIVLGAVLTYFAIGALYARGQAIAAHRRASAQWSSDDNIRESVLMQITFRVFLWPIMLPFDIVRGSVRRWFTAPVTDRKARAEQLRTDARHWRDLQYTGTATEREMAVQLAAMCEERARELDL